MIEKAAARKIIEALRSGVSSHEVGLYFSSARPKIMEEIQRTLDQLAETGAPGGRIFSAKYGEGKTHLLNTIFNIAHSRNMVVSVVTLSKETPLASMGNLYPKIVQGTYLPGYAQPGIAPALRQLSHGAPASSELLEYALTRLAVNRLYFVLKSYLATQDDDEKYLLGADMEGDFVTPTVIRKAYRRIFGEPATFNKNFVKSKHGTDYIAFLAKLFRLAGYDGWVILFDEAELTGRLGRKSRHKAYLNMDEFLHPERFESVYSFFAFNASYIPDVIEAKNEYDGIERNTDLFPDMREKILRALADISAASQLAPLTREETADALEKILRYHGAAYDWSPEMGRDDFMAATDPYGYLLRTRIRAAIEILDNLYQYGEAGELRVSELGQITFDEDEDASLEAFL